ncbi:MAG: IS3 family transposase [Acidobacteria bacterium]|nr:IS3 family transposase [Acidobacteriota bacterium]
MVEKIKAIHDESRRTYGSPKVYRRLRHDGQGVNRKRVARLMRDHDIIATCNWMRPDNRND